MTFALRIAIVGYVSFEEIPAAIVAESHHELGKWVHAVSAPVLLIALDVVKRSLASIGESLSWLDRERLCFDDRSCFGGGESQIVTWPSRLVNSGSEAPKMLDASLDHQLTREIHGTAEHFEMICAPGEEVKCANCSISYAVGIAAPSELLQLFERRQKDFFDRLAHRVVDSLGSPVRVCCG